MYLTFTVLKKGAADKRLARFVKRKRNSRLTYQVWAAISVSYDYRYARWRIRG